MPQHNYSSLSALLAILGVVVAAGCGMFEPKPYRAATVWNPDSLNKLDFVLYTGGAVGGGFSSARIDDVEIARYPESVHVFAEWPTNGEMQITARRPPYEVHVENIERISAQKNLSIAIITDGNHQEAASDSNAVDLLRASERLQN